MYDILQLNDMLLPELLEIAEALKIAGSKKLDKQNLIYKILDKQAILNSAVKDTGKTELPAKKKRIVKTTTAISTEEAIVENEGKEETNEEVKPKIEKKIGKRGRPSVNPQKEVIEAEQKKEEQEDIGNGEDIQSAENIIVAEEPPAKQLFIKKEPAFNVEFDGAIQGEGVLEMMPDGYGF